MSCTLVVHSGSRGGHGTRGAGAGRARTSLGNFHCVLDPLRAHSRQELRATRCASAETCAAGFIRERTVVLTHAKNKTVGQIIPFLVNHGVNQCYAISPGFSGHYQDLELS